MSDLVPLVSETSHSKKARKYEPLQLNDGSMMEIDIDFEELASKGADHPETELDEQLRKFEQDFNTILRKKYSQTEEKWKKELKEIFILITRTANKSQAAQQPTSERKSVYVTSSTFDPANLSAAKRLRALGSLPPSTSNSPMPTDPMKRRVLFSSDAFSGSTASLGHSSTPPEIEFLVKTLLSITGVDVHKALSYVVNERFNHNAVICISQELLKKGADPNKEVCRGGRFALHWAAFRRSNKLAKLLTEKGADVNKLDQGAGESAVFVAVREWKENEVFNIFIKKQGINLFAVNGAGRTLLHEAVIYSNEQATKILLAKGLDPNARDMYKRSPLHWAVMQGNVHFIDLLIQAKADPNLQDVGGNTPLHYCASFGYKEVFDRLIKVPDVDVTIQNSDGQSPLHWMFAAHYHDNVDQIEYLLAEGGSRTQKDKFGRTPIHEMAYWGRRDILRLCPPIESNSDCLDEWIDNDGWTPLHDFAYNGAEGFQAVLDIYDWIVKLGAATDLLNVQDHHGRTPLFIAVQKTRVEVVQGLFHFPADPNLPDKANTTPLHIAVANEHIPLIQILLENGADVDHRDDSNRSPLDLAVRKQKSEILSLFPHKEKHTFRMKSFMETQDLKEDKSKKFLVQAKPLFTASPSFASWKVKLFEALMNKELAETVEALATVHREEPAVEYADPPALSANEHGVMVAITDQLVEMKEGIKSEALSFLVDHSVFPDDFTVEYMINELLKRGTNPIKSKMDRAVPLIHCLLERIKDADILLRLVDKLVLKGVLIDYHPVEDEKLILKVEKPEIERILRSLLEHGAKVSRVVSDFASFAINPDVTRLLLSKGADPKVIAKSKADSTTWNLIDDSTDCFEYLFEYGLSFSDLTNAYGRTPLHKSVAACNSQMEAVKYFLERGAEPDVTDQDGRTPLHEAVSWKNDEAVKLLIHFNASLNIQDYRGKTPLHLAAESGDAAVLDSLLKNGANASVLDNAGKTALDFYIESSYDHSFEDDELWYLQFFVLILSPEAMRWFFNDEEGESSKITDFLIEKMYERSEEDDQAQNTLKRAMNDKHYDKAAETITAMNPRGIGLLFENKETEEKKHGLDSGPLQGKSENQVTSSPDIKLYLEQEVTAKAILDKIVVGGNLVRCDILDSDYSAPVIKVDGPLDIFKLTNFYCCRRTKEDNQTTTFDTIVSNKNLSSHPAIQTLLDYKWRFVRVHHTSILLFYFLRMLVFTLALLIAARPDLDNPGCYRNSWDWARLVFEILSFLYFVWKLYDEGFEIFRDGPRTYFKDYLNWLQLTSVFFPLFCVVPLRAATTWCASTGDGYCVLPAPNATRINLTCTIASSCQWIFASLAYFFNALLVFEIVAVYKTVGLYLWSLVEILKTDIKNFVIFFFLVLYVFMGSFYLALRGGVRVGGNGTITSDLQIHPLDTLYPWHVFAMGLRTLAEGGGVLGGYYAEDTNGMYIGYQWLGVVVYLLFIFFVGIVLLNLLIAQMNKTYENIEKEVRREYYYTLARVLSRYRKSMGPLPSKRFLTIKDSKHEACRQDLGLNAANEKNKSEFVDDKVVCLTKEMTALQKQGADLRNEMVALEKKLAELGKHTLNIINKLDDKRND